MRNILVQEIIQMKKKTVMVSLVGGGGKTTSLFYLAEKLKHYGSVLVTSTTAMFHPHDKVDKTYIDGLPKPTPNGLVAFYKSYDISKDKVLGLSPDVLNDIYESNQFDFILNEADGAKGKPIKAYEDHEPVIPMTSDMVIIVLGADAFNKPVSDKHVFRLQTFKNITGTLDGDLITSQVLLRLLSNTKGLLKDIPPKAMTMLLVNKATSHAITFNKRRFAKDLFLQGPYDYIIYAEMQKNKLIESFKRTDF